MKRDLNLLRDLLLSIESMSPEVQKTYFDFQHLCDDDVKLKYHIFLLVNANFVTYLDTKYSDDNYPRYFLFALTMDGADYLDSVRDNDIWTKTQNALSSVGKSITLNTVKTVAEKFILSSLNL